MIKGYVSRWERRKERWNGVMDYWFTSNPNSAACWETEEEADAGCEFFRRDRIEIPSSLGGIHVCQDFRTEKLEPGRFIVFCEAPFIPVSSALGGS